jgi:hypothetical protein
MKAPNDSAPAADDMRPRGVYQYFARTLRPGSQLRAVDAFGHTSLVHLQQGALDAACGPYCLLMALTILGIAPQRHITRLSQFESGKFVELWRMLAALFFTGSTSTDLIASLRLTPDIGVVPQIFKGRRTGITNFCVEQINNDAVVILETKSAKRSYGDASVNSRAAHAAPPAIRALLCLDPSHSEPVLTAYNARIEVEPSPRWPGAYQVVTSDLSTDRISFEGAIAIRRVQTAD